MNRNEHLLTKLAEECCEVGQRATKALRFGINEVQPDPVDNPKGLSNGQRIIDEIFDVFAVLELMTEAGLIAEDQPEYEEWIKGKKEKIEAMLLYSKEKGTLQ